MNINSLKSKLNKVPLPESEREPEMIVFCNDCNACYWPESNFFHNPPTETEQAYLDSLKREPLTIIVKSWAESCS